MTVIDLNSRRVQRGSARQAEGQMAALDFLRQEISAAGYDTAAQLLQLAIISIAQQMQGRRGD